MDWSGRVIAVLPDQQRVIVEGVNRVKRHTRVAESQRGAKTGGIVTQEAPIHVSNVMLVDSEGKKATRVGFRREEVTKTAPGWLDLHRYPQRARVQAHR